MPAPYPTSSPILIFHSPLFILQLPTLLIKLALAIVQLPAAIFKLAAAVVILSAPIVAHFTLPAVVARIFIVSPTVRVISVINRLLNIANGVVDNIGWAGLVDSVSRVNKEIAESVSLANLKRNSIHINHYSSMQVVDESQFLRCSIAVIASTRC